MSTLTRAAALGALLSTLVATRPARADEPDTNPVRLGVFLGAHFFSTDLELGTADVPDADSPEDAIMGGVRLAYRIIPMLSAEGELAVMPTSARIGDADLTIFGLRLHALAHFTPEGTPWRPFALLGTSWMVMSSTDDRVLDDDADWIGVHAGGGVKYRVDGHTGLRADVRILLPPSSASESVTVDYEVTFGLTRTFGAAQPKLEPEPDRPADPDPDADGIAGEADRCPNEPEDTDGFQDTDGCPDRDNDGDGVLDGDDECPTVPETANGIDDADGCPETDGDGDGILDDTDKCPAVAEDQDGHDDADGCPDPDNDGDGVEDRTDQCPDQAETLNGYQDTDGCPDKLPPRIAKFTGNIAGIRFGRNSATLVGGSTKVLNEAAKVLAEFPDIRVEIQGHTDNRGSLDFNLRLSQRRADAVRDYLVKKGVDPDRLSAVGYGESKPIADNDTRQGRFENRRVEFVLQGPSVITAPATQPSPGAGTEKRQ